jgi:hypothetical protein
VNTESRYVTIGLAALLVASVWTTPSAAQQWGPHGDTGEGLAALGFIKGDPNIVRAQIELGVGHLRHALTALDQSNSSEQIEAASEEALRAYRMMRFSNAGLELLTNKRFPNPLYEMVGKTIWDARYLIIHARAGLAAAVKYPADSPTQVSEAIVKLRQALDLAEQAQYLI